MPNIFPPLYATDGQTTDVILNRMLVNWRALNLNLNAAEGSFIWNVLRTIAIQMSLMNDVAIQTRQLMFMQTAPQLGAGGSPYLDLGGNEKGIPRNPAVAATVVVHFLGNPGVTVPAGTRVSTPVVANVPAQVFATNGSAILNQSGYADVTCTAVTPGANGNVASLSVQFLLDAVPGITQVTNPNPATGGVNLESDQEYLLRYLRLVQAPPASGSEADYANWALSVAGVGGVAVLSSDEPGGPGLDKVTVAIIDTNGQPASQSLIDAVQNYIAPPWKIEDEAENMTLSSTGTLSIDQTQTDDIGYSVLMQYRNNQQGIVSDPIRSPTAAKPQHGGQWDARFRLKRGAGVGTGTCITVRIWNDSAAALAVQTPGGANATLAITAAQLTTNFQDFILRYYDNGTDYLHAEVIREGAAGMDATAQVWFDRTVYQSEFGQSGKTISPTGAFVNVIAAVPVVVNISMALTIVSGYDVANVQSAVTASLNTYMQSISLKQDNDVRYARVGTVILDTPGVADYSNLTMNGGIANVTVGPQQAAVLGTVTFL
jgi:uncharacterized phage protein gp47/JayE